MPTLSENLQLDRRPHCCTANPNLRRAFNADTRDHAGNSPRIWSAYVCGTCESMFTAWAPKQNVPIGALFPGFESI